MTRVLRAFALTLLLACASSVDGPWAPAIGATALSSAQPGAPALLVQTAYDGGGTDTAYDIWRAPDGDYVITGSTQHATRGDHDVVVLKVSPEGAVRWARTLGGPDLDIGFAVRVADSGDIFVAGWTRSNGAGAGDFYLVSLTSAGRVRFERTFGGPGEERATSLAITREGHLAMIGESYSYGDGDSRFYLVLADTTGDLLWEKTYDGGPLHERGLALIELEDGFLLAGNSMDARSGSIATISDGFAVRTDRSGGELWRNRYGGDAHDIVHHVARLAGDRFLLTGYTRGFDARGESDIWLVGINADGQTEFIRTTGNSGADHNILARSDAGGNVWLAGYSRSVAGDWDASISMLDAAGAMRWSHTYGAAGDDGATSLFGPDRHGRLAIAGYTQPRPDASRDILFMVLGAP